MSIHIPKKEILDAPKYKLELYLKMDIDDITWDRVFARLLQFDRNRLRCLDKKGKIIKKEMKSLERMEQL